MAESDDEDLKAAIAMSLLEQETESAAVEKATPFTSFLGFDRKAMEAERLARISKKRPMSISPPPLRDSRKAPKLSETDVNLVGGARLKMLSTSVQREQEASKPAAAQAAIDRMRAQPARVAEESSTPVTSLPVGAIQYPRGVVKRTWAFGHERTGNDVKLEEVLEPLSVRTAVLSAFQWDVQWVLSKLRTPLNGGSTKCVFVMHAKQPADQHRWRTDASDMRHFLRLCFPEISGVISCMHSKLMLLFHPSKLRIAIPTANLLAFDWGETGHMENSVFMIDLPRLPNGQKTAKNDLTPFGQELMYFIAKQDFDQDVQEGVLNFDFSATKDMAFVHTVGGVHYGDEAARTGLLGLNRAVRTLNLATTSQLEIDFAASSIGALTDKQLKDFHTAARGVDLVVHAREARAKASATFFKGKKLKITSSETNSSVRNKIRIYFPTEDTVRSSTAGAAGTICIQRTFYEKDSFPKECFRDYKSTRPGLLSHNKILYARGIPADMPRGDGSTASSSGTSAESSGKKQIAWVYIGSSNMSQSAWGRMAADSTGDKITCRNWECGVLLPVRGEALPPALDTTQPSHRDENGDSDTESEDNTPEETSSRKLIGFEAFQNVVHLPFQVPGDTYEGREPWYFMEQE